MYTYFYIVEPCLADFMIITIPKLLSKMKKIFIPHNSSISEIKISKKEKIIRAHQNLIEIKI